MWVTSSSATEGFLVVDHNGIRAIQEHGRKYQRGRGTRRGSREPRKIRKGDGGEARRTSRPTPHMKNFFDAIRARDHKLLNADIAIGARSAAFCHLANIAYRVGQLSNGPEDGTVHRRREGK